MFALSHGPVALEASILDPVAVNSWRMLASQLPLSRSFASVEVDVFDVKSMNVAIYIPKQSETDVDLKEIRVFITGLCSNNIRINQLHSLLPWRLLPEALKTS